MWMLHRKWVVSAYSGAVAICFGKNINFCDTSVCCRQHVTFIAFFAVFSFKKFFCTKFQTDVSCSPISNNSDGSFKTLIKILCLISSCFWRSDSSIGLCKWGLSEFWLVWIVGYLYEARYSIKKILILAHSQLERFTSYLNHMRCMKWFSEMGAFAVSCLHTSLSFPQVLLYVAGRSCRGRGRGHDNQNCYLAIVFVWGWQNPVTVGQWATHFYEGN